MDRQTGHAVSDFHQSLGRQPHGGTFFKVKHFQQFPWFGSPTIPERFHNDWKPLTVLGSCLIA